MRRILRRLRRRPQAAPRAPLSAPWLVSFPYCYQAAHGHPTPPHVPTADELAALRISALVSDAYRPSHVFPEGPYIVTATNATPDGTWQRERVFPRILRAIRPDHHA